MAQLKTEAETETKTKTETKMKAPEAREIVRLSLTQRLQHGLLMISVTLLILSGLALTYSDSWWGRLMITLEGGFEARGWIHRGSAVLLMITAVYHLIYILFTRRGHEEFMHILLKGRDFADWWNTLRYDLGLRAEKPKLDRYGYAEKFQYWAFVLFSGLMIVSGLILWFHNDLFGVLPKWAFDAAITGHGALGTLILAFLTLWHLYIVHLSPGRFPMNWSWWDGMISERQLREDHPLEYERLRRERERNRQHEGAIGA